MRHALMKLFNDIQVNGLTSYGSHVEHPKPTWSNLMSLLTEGEKIRFEKEYDACLDMGDRAKFDALHKTYSLSVRSKTLDAFFVVLYNFGHNPFSWLKWYKKSHMFIFKHFVSKYYVWKMRKALDKC